MFFNEHYVNFVLLCYIPQIFDDFAGIVAICFKLQGYQVKVFLLMHQTDNGGSKIVRKSSVNLTINQLR